MNPYLLLFKKPSLYKTGSIVVPSALVAFYFLLDLSKNNLEQFC
jgi:hypothetical protein